MIMPWWMIVLFIMIGGVAVWASIFLCKISEEEWDRVTSAPKFIIKPSYSLGFDIWEKELWPLPGRAPMMHYRPLFGHYETREAAEEQLKHYQSNDEVTK